MTVLFVSVVVIVVCILYFGIVVLYCNFRVAYFGFSCVGYCCAWRYGLVYCVLELGFVDLCSLVLFAVV